jgi:hypothetical protein
MRSFPSLTKLDAFAALLLAGYFLYYSLGSLRTEFTPDDLMNCYFAWLRPISGHFTDMLLFFRLSPTFRPFGALVYKVSFTLFGFNLVPLRLLLLLVLGVNMVLAYALASRLTGLREAGVIAALLGAYHENSAHLLYNSARLYDIFCFFFYFGALLYYVRVRETGHPVRPSKVLLFSLLYILALDSKEMAVSLPVMACAYELLFHSHQWLRRAFLRRLWRDGAAVWVSGCITAAFIAGRGEWPRVDQPVGRLQACTVVRELLERSRASSRRIVLRARLVQQRKNSGLSAGIARGGVAPSLETAPLELAAVHGGHPADRIHPAARPRCSFDSRDWIDDLWRRCVDPGA